MVRNQLGIGLYFISPVMYIDMTNAWRLESKKRVLVDIGGVYFQAITTIFLSIIALLSGNKTYYLCNVSVLIMTLSNLMPFLKLDGYWFFCDYFKISNVSNKAFKVINLRLKHLLTEKKDSLIVNNNQSKAFYVFSFIYVFSTVITIIMGCVYSITVISNRKYVIETIKIIGSNLNDNNFMEALTNLNDIFIYIIPLIFIGLMVLRIFEKIIKGVINNDRIKKYK